MDSIRRIFPSAHRRFSGAVSLILPFLRGAMRDITVLLHWKGVVLILGLATASIADTSVACAQDPDSTVVLPQPEFYICTKGKPGYGSQIGVVTHVDGSRTYVHEFYDPELSGTYRQISRFDPNDQIGCYDVALFDYFSVLHHEDIPTRFEEYRYNCLVGINHSDWALNHYQLRHARELYDMAMAMDDQCLGLIKVTPPPSHPTSNE
jgi:hypothetical protein